MTAIPPGRTKPLGVPETDPRPDRTYPCRVTARNVWPGEILELTEGVTVTVQSRYEAPARGVVIHAVGRTHELVYKPGSRVRLVGRTDWPTPA